MNPLVRLLMHEKRYPQKESLEFDNSKITSNKWSITPDMLKSFRRLNFSHLLQNSSFKKMSILKNQKLQTFKRWTLIRSNLWQIFDGILIHHKNYKKCPKFPFKEKVKMEVVILDLRCEDKVIINQKVNAKFVGIIKFF